MDPQQYRWFKHSLIVLGALMLAVPAKAQEASEAGGLSLTFMPMSIVSVKGDKERFQQQEWISDGYSYGLKDINVNRDLADDVTLTFEGKTIPDENDHKAELSLTKKDVGYIDIAYDMFRKYYDGSGGVYPLFSTLNAAQLTEDLHMDMSHFLMEVGTPKDDVRGVSLAYERETKIGKKSRLTWSVVKEGATTRDIGPVWQHVDEETNSIKLKGRTELKGVAVKGEQLFEKTRINSFRQESNLATTGVAADTKIRRQVQEPDTNILATTFEASKWMNENKTFLGAGYRYNHLKNTELEYLNEFDASGVPAAYSNPKNKYDAWAKNNLDTHTWNAHGMTKLTADLSLNVKLRAEAISRRSHSVYPGDTTSPPDGIANTTNYNEVENSVGNFGEGLSLNYNGISHTSLYAEMESTQGRNWISERLFNVAGQSPADPGSDFTRETLTFERSNSVTLGGRSLPFRWLTLTSQVRQKWDSNDYDDVTETASSSGSAKSSFIDYLAINGAEVANRITLKPVNWFQPSFRYTFANKKYITRIENDINEEEADLISQTYGYDLFLYPADQVLLDFGYTKGDSKVATLVASSASSPQIPGFISDVDSWMASGSYSPKDNLSFTNTFTYTTATNYDNFSTIGLPYGADFKKYDITLEANWQVKENVGVQPHYSYFYYEPGNGYEFGGYRAHVVWFDVNVKW